MNVYFRVLSAMKTRLTELKQYISSDANEEKNYACGTMILGSLMKEINYHIDYLETTQDTPVNDIKVLINFTKFKMELSEYQNEYAFQLQTKRLEKMTEKFDKMTQKFEEKTNECKELKAKIKSLENFNVESQNDRQRISLSSVLVVKAHWTGSLEEPRFISFDDGYTNYDQLRDVFCLEPDSFTLKYVVSDGESKQMCTSDDYKEAVKATIANQLFDVPISVIKLHIETSTENTDSAPESSSEAKSTKDNVSGEEYDEHNDSCSEVSIPDSPPVRIQQDVTWDRPEDVQRDNMALDLLPRSKHEELDSGAYHWTIRDWSSLDGAVYSDTFDVGGYKWRIKIYPKNDISTDDKFISIYLVLDDNILGGTRVHTEWVFTISSPKDATNYHNSHLRHYTFCKRKGWGLKEFYSIKNLRQLHNGKGPFVIDDQCVVSAYVRVVKDLNTDN
ncbi:hypothetical protein DFQ30_011317 [Apophysomyces sp. BC1015]|nr:hypothetical protein DFQ30_011317 [Apophysomyces sp. BC1015]